MKLFVIDKIVDDIVIIENIETMEITKINKNQVIGDCNESNVLIKNADNYVFSNEETTIRTNYIKDLTKGFWN